MRFSYRHTKFACYAGYITQAIINNLSPLLFIIYQQDLGLSLTQISLMITVNFLIQMGVDLLSAKFVDRIGYRPCAVAAHLLSVAGLVGISLFPLLVSPYPALLLATGLGAVGGGLLEVLVSPIIEAIPGKRKESEMSLLHSFYCWGHVGVVTLSTVFFLLAGQQNWRLLPLLWAAVPLMNALLFAKVPLKTLTSAGGALSIRALAKQSAFWLFMLLMLCAGASEMAMSQWASYFAEKGLHVSKTLGDLMGPCAFAILMGTARILFGKSTKYPVEKALTFSALLCMLCYGVVILSSSPLISLVGCAVCGFSVGVMWPGVFSMASARLPSGGTALFALLALAGDIGCCSGPSLVGAVSDWVNLRGTSFLQSLFAAIDLSQLSIKTGFALALLFPALLFLGVFLLKRLRHPKRSHF